MQYTKTLYSWADVCNLYVGTKFTDSTGTDYWSLGGKHILDDCGNFVSRQAIELPVTVEMNILRLRVYRSFGIREWTVRGEGVYATFPTYAEAITWAQKAARL